MEDKSKMEIVEEIMRASEDETRKIFAEMFNCDFALSDKEEKGTEDKGKMEIVEEIMRASEDETRKIFAEMFNHE